jgi:mono/diheme cytochrome c family protein
VSRKAHLRIGLIYALGAWMSLAVITGILGFMLTPGRWPETGGFFDGFFSETFWPQLLLRTSMMFAIAGAYAAAVAATMRDGGRETVRRLAGCWGLAGLAAGAACALWYWAKLPDHSRDVLGSVAYAGIALKVAVGVGTAMGFYFLALALGKGSFAVPAVAVSMMGVLFVGVGGGESVREIVRRPWVIPGYMYSNQIVGGEMPAKGVTSEVPALDRDGLLARHPFVPSGLRAVTAANYLEAGEAVVKIECLACHTLEARGRNSLVRRYRNVATEAVEIYDHLGMLGNYSYMPPFVGTDSERRAAAAYLTGLAGGTPADPSWAAGGN